MHTVEYYTTMKKMKSYTCYNMSELENTVLRGKKKKKPNTKDHVHYDSIHVKYSEWEDV